ncbi:MAG: hypothetical protein PW999_07840 [Paraburkholderia tropica]|nr:hypothetical protein [Paraburkholderia tropica]
MNSKPTIEIAVNGAGRGTAHVDGVEIKFVQSVTTEVAANEAPIVKLSLAVPDTLKLRYEGADLIVDNIIMPESIEVAMWRHLSSKYGKREVDATTIRSNSCEWLLRDA